MTGDRRFRLRVTYAVDAKLAMLSHLEIARTLERIIRRAKLPFAVSNGFSPHMRIAFGSALPVGVGGDAEVFDIQLADYVAPQRALEALEAASAPGITIIDCAYVENSAPAASVAYPISTYVARLDRSIERLEVPEAITVVRKKKERTVRVADHLMGDVLIDGDELTFSLEALDTGSLRPDVFLDAAFQQTFGSTQQRPQILSLTRTAQSPAAS